MSFENPFKRTNKQEKQTLAAEPIEKFATPEELQEKKEALKEKSRELRREDNKENPDQDKVAQLEREHEELLADYDNIRRPMREFAEDWNSARELNEKYDSSVQEIIDLYDEFPPTDKYGMMTETIEKDNERWDKISRKVADFIKIYDEANGVHVSLLEKIKRHFNKGEDDSTLKGQKMLDIVFEAQRRARLEKKENSIVEK